MIVIREAVQDDLSSIKAIEDRCFTTPWSSGMLSDEISGERTYFAVAQKGTELVGYALLKHIIDEGCIENIAVAKEHRGKKIGDELLRDLLNRCEMLKIHKVFLEVRESNTLAIGLYTKHKFEKVFIRENYYKNPQENAVIMVKIFEVENANTRN